MGSEAARILVGLAHDLRTPLNSVIGFAELLLDGRAGALTAQQKEFIGDISTAGLQLLSMINALVELARWDTGVIPVSAAPTDLLPILERAVETLQRAGADRDVAIHRTLPVLPEVLADPVSLEQLISKLLSCVLAVSPSHSRIALRATISDQTVRLEVEDAASEAEGTGELEARWLGLHARPARCDLLGLRLALVERLALAQGGSFEVGPALAGSTSAISLPRPRWNG